MALAVRWALRSLCPRTASRVFFSAATTATAASTSASQQRQWVEAGSGDVKRNAQAPASDNEQAEGQTAAQKLSAALRRVTYNDVAEAYKRIRGTVKKTPCDYSPALSEMTGCHLYIKKEHISMTGSYKERGALNKILQLTAAERAKGVICNSAGNHAQAVSHHATRLGIDGLIVMPETAPFVKVASTRFFGAKVLLHGKGFDDAYQKAMEIVREEGRTLVHAFNDPAVVAGQGTVAMEMLEQCAFLDAVVVPIGGGGLLAGMALAIKKINPRIKVYGVEAQAMPGMYKSVLGGKPTFVPRQKTMADGIAIENVGDVPFALIKDYVDEIVLVNEDEIASAILTLLETEKTVVEGSGACALAAVMFRKELALTGLQVGIITTGGNIDMSLLGRIIDRGLVTDGRVARLRVVIEDVPGQIARISSILAEQRALVREVEHDRAFLGTENVGYTAPTFTIETRDHEHVAAVLAAVRAAGFTKTTLASGSTTTTPTTPAL